MVTGESQEVVQVGRKADAIPGATRDLYSSSLNRRRAANKKIRRLSFFMLHAAKNVTRLTSVSTAAYKRIGTAKDK
jgi:hypothetical protein